ncbi:hypothetical protein DV738_g1803, partial [Chaetothyriales sp. CBS 135597]
MAAGRLLAESAPLSLFKRCVQCPDTSPSCPSCASGETCQLITQSCDACASTKCVKIGALPGQISSKPSTPIGAIVGGVVGGVVFVAIAVFLFYWFYVRRKRQAALSWSPPEKRDPKTLHPYDRQSARSVASTVLSRASNVIQIAYIPGVTVRSPPDSPGNMPPPMPAFPGASNLSSVQGSPVVEQHFFMPSDLRSSTWSDSSSSIDPRVSVTPSLARTTLYGEGAIIAPVQQASRAQANVVSVKSGSSSAPSIASSRTPPVPQVPKLSNVNSSIIAKKVTARPIEIRKPGSGQRVPTLANLAKEAVKRKAGSANESEKSTPVLDQTEVVQTNQVSPPAQPQREEPSATPTALSSSDSALSQLPADNSTTTQELSQSEALNAMIEEAINRARDPHMSMEESSQRSSSESLPDAPPLTAAAESADSVALTNLFHDDDFDEEGSSNGNTMPSSPPDQPDTSSEPEGDQPEAESYSDPNLMLQFYSRLFPFRTLFGWLNHSPKPGTDFSNREFAFTLPNDAYIRYESYPTADLLRRDILRLNPVRFEIGPVYTTNPRDRKTVGKAFKPLSKEMVFDIDLTDYDDIRSCCTKANICSKCWTFATMAIKVLDVALRDDFGFEHVMWVYSGRRGVHAWISDKDARELDDQKRKTMIGYFEVLRGGAQGGKRVNVKRPLHPHLARSLDILKPYFEQSILVDQEPFLSDEGQERLLQLLPDKALNDALRKKWASSPDRPSARKWADINALAEAGVSSTLNTRALLEAKQDILLEYTYPRLDVAVGKTLNHLLKSPFVVHPGTGRVCVPITTTGDMSQVDAFNPLTVPKVTELLRDVDAYTSALAHDGHAAAVDGEYVAADGKSMRKVNDWEKTRLKPYVEMFEAFVKSLWKSEAVRVKRERDDEGITGANGMAF